MTTTNIAGLEIPDDVIAEAGAVADALDRIVPEVMVLLDRATASISALEIADHERHQFNRPDETLEALGEQTAHGRLIERFDELHDRTEDIKMYTDERRRVEDQHHSARG